MSSQKRWVINELLSPWVFWPLILSLHSGIQGNCSTERTKDFPGVQWLRLHATNARGMSLIPDREIKSPHTTMVCPPPPKSFCSGAILKKKKTVGTKKKCWLKFKSTEKWRTIGELNRKQFQLEKSYQAQ